MNPQEFRAKVLALVDRVQPADRELVLQDIRRYLGRRAEVRGLAWRAAAGAAYRAWTEGDLLLAAEARSWPLIVIQGQRFVGEDQWRELLTGSDDHDRRIIHGALRAACAAEPDELADDADPAAEPTS
jgi:hypothetical protein